MNEITVKSWGDVPDGYRGAVYIASNVWYVVNNRVLHREDGPASIKPGGHKQWWFNNHCIGSSVTCIHLDDCIVLNKIQDLYYVILTTEGVKYCFDINPVLYGISPNHPYFKNLKKFTTL